MVNSLRLDRERRLPGSATAQSGWGSRVALSSRERGSSGGSGTSPRSATGGSPYEQARLLAGTLPDSTVEAWIERAETETCVALRDELDTFRERQLRPQGDLALRLPRRVAKVLLSPSTPPGRWPGSGSATASAC
jgi:hypothetical protein